MKNDSDCKNYKNTSCSKKNVVAGKNLPYNTFHCLPTIIIFFVVIIFGCILLSEFFYLKCKILSYRRLLQDDSVSLPQWSILRCEMPLIFFFDPSPLPWPKSLFWEDILVRVNFIKCWKVFFFPLQIQSWPTFIQQLIF